MIPRTLEWRSVAWLLGAIFCCHLLVAGISYRGKIQDDAESYVLIGGNLSQGYGFVFEKGGRPTSWRAPGYPFELAAVFSLFGVDFTAARAANALCWTLTAAVILLLALRTVGSESAILAAALVGFSPTFLGFTGLLWSESLFILLFTTAVLGIFSLAGRPSLSSCLLTGIALGAAILTRSTAIVLFPALWIVLWRSKGKLLLSAALASFCALGIVGSWTARNWYVHHAFIPVESNTGYNLFAGQQPDTPIPFAWKVLKNYRQSARYRALTENKTESEQNAALQRAAIGDIMARPGRSVLLALGKVFDFWLPDFFIPANVRAGSYGPQFQGFAAPVLVLTCSFFLIVVAAALYTGIRGRDLWYVQGIALICILYTVPHAIVYGASRYHEPLTPLLIVLAAPALQHWRRIVEGWRKRRRSVTVAARP
jgi:4-amino-4-deoxy-L-arabinose transferase-like glycosyltransferase